MPSPSNQCNEQWILSDRKLFDDEPSVITKQIKHNKPVWSLLGNTRMFKGRCAIFQRDISFWMLLNSLGFFHTNDYSSGNTGDSRIPFIPLSVVWNVLSIHNKTCVNSPVVCIHKNTFIVEWNVTHEVLVRNLLLCYQCIHVSRLRQQKLSDGFTECSVNASKKQISFRRQNATRLFCECGIWKNRSGVSVYRGVRTKTQYIYKAELPPAASVSHAFDVSSLLLQLLLLLLLLDL